MGKSRASMVRSRASERMIEVQVTYQAPKPKRRQSSPFDCFHRVAIEWKGTHELLRRRLVSERETKKRQRCLQAIQSSPEAMEFAEKVLITFLIMLKHRREQEPGRSGADRSLLERILVQLRIVQAEVGYVEWPTLHQITSAYERYAYESSAPVHTLLT